MLSVEAKDDEIKTRIMNFLVGTFISSHLAQAFYVDSLRAFKRINQNRTQMSRELNFKTREAQWEEEKPKVI